MTCKRCGTCCKSLFFARKDILYDRDEKEIARLAEYHYVKTMKYVAPDGKAYLAFKYPLPCIHLKEEDGVCVCTIYDTRPVICKEYLCKKARE
jgi:Fe-S-cluster containining protein